jgi:hypothetical protein
MRSGRGAFPTRQTQRTASSVPTILRSSGIGHTVQRSRIPCAGPFDHVRRIQALPAQDRTLLTIRRRSYSATILSLYSGLNERREGRGDGPSSARGPDRGGGSSGPPARSRRSSVDTDTRISDHSLEWEQLLGKLSQVILTERALLPSDPPREEEDRNVR